MLYFTQTVFKINSPGEMITKFSSLPAETFPKSKWCLSTHKLAINRIGRPEVLLHCNSFLGPMKKKSSNQRIIAWRVFFFVLRGRIDSDWSKMKWKICVDQYHVNHLLSSFYAAVDLWCCSISCTRLMSRFFWEDSPNGQMSSPNHSLVRTELWKIPSRSSGLR